jgi:RHS repeat-associated protein
MMDFRQCFSTQCPPIRPNFTGKERDAETGLDFFEARYFSSPQGRFMSPDPENAGVSPEDPQSWNAYAYARNNPLLYTDPDGMRYKICDSEGKNCAEVNDEDYNKWWKSASKSFYQAGGKIYQRDVTGLNPLGTVRYMGSDQLFAVAQGTELARPVVEATAAATLVFANAAMIGGALAGGGALTTLGAINSGSGAAAAVNAGTKITFSAQGAIGHGARHLAKTGLSREVVETAIRAEVKAAVSGASSTGSFWGKVVIQGRTILYKAYTVSKDVINIGTYYAVK